MQIRFGRDDLARVRFMISPMGETVLSISALQLADGRLPFARWRDAQRPKLAGASSRVLLDLVPAGWRPEVALAPVVGERPLFEEELDAVLGFSPHPLRAYLAMLGSPILTMRWMPMVPDDAGDERRLLAGLLSDYHRRCVAEYWPAIRVQLEADIAERRRLHAERGIAGVLATLHPAVRWSEPILEVRVPGPRRHVDLEGRGLVLVPSVFMWPCPTVLVDGTGQPVLIYPARGVPAVWSAPAYDHHVLAVLLGPTRAAILLAAACGDSTSRLADQLEISLASVSQHLTVLRNAGLVRSTRRGRAVHHDLTQLGVQLLLASGLSARTET